MSVETSQSQSELGISHSPQSFLENFSTDYRLAQTPSSFPGNGAHLAHLVDHRFFVEGELKKLGHPIVAGE